MKNFDGYFVANKSIIRKNDYVGVGISKGVQGGALFIEIGSSWDMKNPGISVGAIIPFNLKL